MNETRQNNYSKCMFSNNSIGTEDINPSESRIRYFLDRTLAPSLMLFSKAGSLFLNRGKASPSSASVKMYTDGLKKAIIYAYEDVDTLSFWNYDEALQRMGGDPELLNERIKSFIDEAPALFYDIKGAAAEGDLPGVQKSAYFLKSKSANIVAPALRVISKKLEFAARDRQTSAVKVSLISCERIFNETISTLKKFLLSDDATINESSVHDSHGIVQKLEYLRQMIEKSVFVDTMTMKIFGQYSDANTTELMAELKKSIDKLEYDYALELIQRAEKIFK